MKKSILGTAAILILVGCSSLSKDHAITKLQAETSRMLALASSDELVISKVNLGEADLLGGQSVSYRATTGKGRIFDCSSYISAGFLGDPPKLGTVDCKPIVAHQ